MAQSLWNRVARDGEGVRFGKCSQIVAALATGQADCTIGGCTPTIITAATPHSAGQSRATRVPNLSGQYN